MTNQPLRGHASGGVSRIAAISSCMTTLDRASIFFGVFLISFIYTLDQTIRFASQPASTADFGVHSMQATINVFRAVISAAAQPTSAKIADVFGRVELICVSIFFYVVGTIIEAAAPNVDALAAGSVIYQIGYTMIILLIEVIVGDVTSTRARLFFSYMSALPFIITTWVSGDISGALFDNNKKLWRWRWSLGMFTVIYTVSALPLILSIWFISRRAKRQGKLVDYLSAFAKLDLRSFVVQLFWLLDVVGVVLVVVVFGLILAPVTLAGGITTEWSKAKIIAPLVIGVLGIPLFIAWELKGARYPLVPFPYMKDRSVWAPMGIAIVYNFTYAMNADFLYTVLLVAFDFDVKTSTRITSLYSFTGAIVGPIFGLLAYKIRRLKIITISGTMLYTVGFGVLIHYRGMGSSQAGVIGGQVLLGIASGLFPYPAQAALQVSLKHEHLAVMTGLFLAMFSVGTSIGSAVTGAIWSQMMPRQLEQHLGPLNASLPELVYGNPFTYTALYPMGTPEREAIVTSYKHVQRVLLTIGACGCAPLIFFALMLRNLKLDDNHTLAKDSDTETDSTMRNEACRQ